VADLPWVMALDSWAEILVVCNLPFCDRVLRLSGKRNPTVRDFTHDTGRERLEHHLTGTFEELVRLVIPELQRRGVYRKAYAGTTLRDHLGLACPEVGTRRHSSGAGGAEIRPPPGVDQVGEKVYQNVTRKNGVA
jgi:hypothetical protein